MTKAIELSQLDLLIMQAIINSIYSTQELDRKSNSCFTQAQRIGNFTTFLRRETCGLIEMYCCGQNDVDKSDLRRWLSRLTSTKHWIDVASPDYHGNRYYRSPFQLILSGTWTKVMDVERMKTLCDLAKERVKFHSPSTQESGEISPDNFQFRLEAIIASANQNVAEANSLSKQASSLLSNFSTTPTT